VDNTLFLRSQGKDILIVQVYVDDIIFEATNEAMCKEFAEMMGNEFEMSMMGGLNFFLGLQIKKTPTGIMIHQQKYIKASKSIDTPIAIATKLDLYEGGKSVEQKLYRGMIGSLLYLKASRPDIVFSVGLFVRF